MYNGIIIKELLEEQGKSHAEFLEYMGLNPKCNSITSFMNGNPSAARLEKIADFFGITIDSLFAREKEDNQEVNNNGAPLIQNNNSGSRYKVISTINLKNDIKHLEEKVAMLEERLKDKERMIRDKETIIEQLKKRG